MVVSAPTGSGKTAVFELALLALCVDDPSFSFKAVYMAPIKVCGAESPCAVREVIVRGHLTRAGAST